MSISTHQHEDSNMQAGDGANPMAWIIREYTDGTKKDEGKPRLDLLDADFILDVGRVLSFGAGKYDESLDVWRNNWRQGMRWGRVAASLLRHAFAILRGEELDEETGLPHAAHIGANAMFLHYYRRRHRALNDLDVPWRKVPKVWLDLDNVLADWTGQMSAFLGHDELPMWWQFVEKGKKFMPDEEYGKFLLDLPPLVHGAELPFEPVGVVTHRPACFEGETRQWLSDNGFPKMEVRLVSNREDKAAILKEVGADIFVDDNYETFVELNNAGILCYLLDQPWNERYDVGSYRIYSLSEVRTW